MQCYWNWYCWMDLDCNLRILTPAVAECTLDVMIPACVFTSILVCGVLACVWCFTRPWSSLVLFGTFITGIYAISTTSLFVYALWVFTAIGFNYFYFYVSVPPLLCSASLALLSSLLATHSLTHSLACLPSLTRSPFIFPSSTSS